MKRIPVRQARKVVTFALVDDADAPLVENRTWRLSRGYAVTWVTQTTNVFMHRLILNSPDGMSTDHINGDKLDNRRENLRVVTQAQNNQNLPSHRASTSRFRGVSWRTAKNKWAAQVRIDGQTRHLGYFDDELEAARVAAQARAEHMPFANPERDGPSVDEREKENDEHRSAA